MSVLHMNKTTLNVWKHKLFPDKNSEQNGQQFAGDIFKFISFSENLDYYFDSIFTEFVPLGSIDHKSALVEMMDWLMRQ